MPVEPTRNGTKTYQHREVNGCRHFESYHDLEVLPPPGQARLTDTQESNSLIREVQIPPAWRSHQIPPPPADLASPTKSEQVLPGLSTDRLTISRVLTVLASALTILGLVAGLYWWLVPAPVVRAYIEVPEVAISSPITGLSEIHVRLGQSVMRGDLLATVKLPQADAEALERDKDQLLGEIEALRHRKEQVQTRLAMLRASRNEQAAAQSKVDVAHMEYDLVRDYGGSDYAGISARVKQTVERIQSLAKRLDGLLASGAASRLETDEAVIRQLSQEILLEHVSRDQKRTDLLSRSLSAWKTAEASFCAWSRKSPTNEEIQDLRLNGEINFELNVRETRLKALKATRSEYQIRSPHDGIVTRLAEQTQLAGASPVVHVTNPAGAVLVVRAPYGRFESRWAKSKECRFRLRRGGQEGVAKIVSIRRGVREQDRTLATFDLVEYVARLQSNISGLVPGEVVTLLP